MVTALDDLLPGDILTLAELDKVSAKVFAAFANDPLHGPTLAAFPVAQDLCCQAAHNALARQKPVAGTWHDYDLAYNFHFWLQQFTTYGVDGINLVWDEFERIYYPFPSDRELNRFCASEGLGFIQNIDACVAQFLPILPGMLDALENGGVRFIANHATWMSQGIIIILLFHSLQYYAQQQPSQRDRIERLGLLDPMAFGSHIHTLLGPWIPTTGQALSDISDISAMRGINALGHVIKVFPDTESGRMPFFPYRWKKEIKRVLKLLYTIEATPGSILIETPSARADDQRNGTLSPYPMARAAVRVGRFRTSQIVLVGLDERELFDSGFDEGSFQGGRMKPGRVGLRLEACWGQRPENHTSHCWPFTDWHDVETRIAGLIHNPDGQAIGQVFGPDRLQR